MAIEYSYEIISVNAEAGTMEVLYTADGLPDQLIGARLPTIDEDEEAVIAQYSPVNFWREISAERKSIPTGMKGTLREYEEPLPTDKERIAQRRFVAETSGVSVNGVTIQTDRESQAMLTGAVVSAQLDPSMNARWKLNNGEALLGKADLEAIAIAVRSHVQACFNRELDLIAMVDAGTFTDDDLDIGWPA